MVRLVLWQKRLHSCVATVSLSTTAVLAQISNWSRDRVLLPSMQTLWGWGEHQHLLSQRPQPIYTLRPLGLGIKNHLLGRVSMQCFNVVLGYLRKYGRVKNRLDSPSIDGEDGDDHAGQEE